MRLVVLDRMLTIAEALRQGVEFHQRGDLLQAEKLYRQVLETNVRNADAWHLLGLVAHARGTDDEAIEAISRAIKLDGRQPSFHHHLAEVYRSMRRHGEAEASCRQALVLKEDFAPAHCTLGVILMNEGRIDDAEGCFRRALAIDPQFALPRANLASVLHAQGRLDEAVAECRGAIACDPALAMAYHELGLILHEQGKADEAIDALREALRVDPRLAAAECSLGTLLQLQSRLDEAIDCYRRALATDPNLAQAHCNLGSALKDRGQAAEAARCYRRAVQCDPSLAEAHYNLGILLQRQGRAAGAMQCYRDAIRARADYAQAHNNLGMLYLAQGDLEKAGVCLSKALEFKPDSADVVNNLGNLMKFQGRWTEARVCYQQALQIAGDYALAHFNLAQWLLADGDFATGWSEYEWRSRCPEFAKHPLHQPRWQGDALVGRALLVRAEQGLGDTMQFVRYVGPLAQRGGTIILEVQRALVRLLKQSPVGELAQLVAAGDPLPKFDAYVPLLSLPGIFGTTPENIPAAGGYLSADPGLVEQWRGALGDAGPFKVGIAWQGRPAYGDYFRSIPLASFAPLALDGVELVSLQKGPGALQLAALGGQFPVRDLGPELDEAHGAFMDTAAVMKNLDLVVTSDTATAHLAGALGVEVWVALTLAPDWRWMRERTDSPWYASMRLFRQTQLGDWAGVFERMAEALRQFTRAP